MSEQHPDEHLVWKEIDRRTLLDAHVFSVLGSRRRSADGAEAEYYLLDSVDWCNVIAPFKRDDGVDCFVMARQYRHGSQSVTIEFPGGLVDPGETPEQAVLRELAEETGFVASRVTLIGKVNPNPAFMSNSAYTFLAHDVYQNGGQSLDHNERLDAELVPVQELLELMRPDFHVHAIMTVALHWYRLFLEDGLDYAARVQNWEERYAGTNT